MSDDDSDDFDRPLKPARQSRCKANLSAELQRVRNQDLRANITALKVHRIYE